MITFFERDNQVWYAMMDSGVVLGQLIRSVDGYYYFWFHDEDDLEWGSSRGGCWPAWVLHEIATALDIINEPWDTLIKNDPSIGCPHPSS